MKKIFLFFIILFILNYNQIFSSKKGYRKTKLYSQINPEPIINLKKTFKHKIIIFGVVEGILYALNSENGNKLWQFPIGRTENLEPIEAYNNQIFIGRKDGWVFCINALNGEIIWQRFINEPIYETPKLIKNRLFVPGYKIAYFVLDIKNGDIIHRFNNFGRSSTPEINKDLVLLTGFRSIYLYKINGNNFNLLWQKNFNIDFNLKPCMDNNAIYVGFTNGKIEAFNIENGDILWSFETRGSINTKIYSLNKKIYAGSNDGNLYCIDAKSGKKLFEFSTGKGLIGNIFGRGRNIFFAAKNGIVYCIDFERGFEKWRFFFQSEKINFLYLLEDSLIINSPENSISLISSISGELYWSFSPGYKFNEVITHKNQLIFSNTNGKSLFRYDINKKNIIWQSDLNEIINFRVYIYDDYILAFNNYNIFIINFENGEIIKKINKGIECPYIVLYKNQICGYKEKKVFCLDINTESLLWEREIVGILYSGLVLKDNTIYFGTSTGDFYSINITNGFINYQINLKSDIYSIPVIDEKNVYIGTKNRVLLSFNKLNGNMIWEFKTFGEVLTTPVIDEGKIYFACKTHYIYALNKNNGIRIWSSMIQTRFNTKPEIFGDYLITSGSNDVLYLFNLKNGDLRGEYFFGNEVVGNILVYNNYIIFTSKNGAIFILEEDK